jgi:hypothetical protein
VLDCRKFEKKSNNILDDSSRVIPVQQCCAEILKFF